MIFAIIGGPHGCAAALESAFARIDAHGIHTVLCTGNLVVGGSGGDRVIELLRARRVTCVQGELDRMAVRALRKSDAMRARLDAGAFDALQRAHESLSSANIEFLRALPHRLSVSFEGKSVCLCHGTVASQSGVLAVDDPPERFRRQREAANTDVVICGSDGEAFVRTVDQTLFINPGRLDAPGYAASFAIADTDADPMSGEIVRID